MISQLNFIPGPKAFSRYALAIAPSLQELRNHTAFRGIFVHRLVFAVNYAQFHHLREKQEYQDAATDLMALFRDEEAPKPWWAVLLCDSIDLLQYGM